MRIGIEGQRLFRVKKHGMDMVALELIRNLQQVDKENEYFVFVHPDDDKGCLTETSNFKIIEVPGGPYPIWEQMKLPKAISENRCDLIHCTSNTAPTSLKIPLVLTLHDIIYMEHSYWNMLTGGGTAYQRFGNIYRRMNVPKVVKKSEKIITVSHFEKDRIGEFFGLKSDRLRAVYNGVGDHFKPITDPNEKTRIKKQYHLPDRYVFFLGNPVEKKNTPGTLKAFALFRGKTGLDMPLVMLDYELEELKKTLADIGEPKLLDHIHLTGYVPNDELPAIYSLADLFLYTSFRESFGIPILEAQKCGTHVVTSNTSSMPEVAGEGALLVDPYKPDEICDAMIKLVDDPDLSERIRQKGLENAQKYSWKAMAQQVLSIYNEVFEEMIKG